MRRRDAIRGAGVVLTLGIAGCSGDGGGGGAGAPAPPEPPDETTDGGGPEFTTTTPTPDPAPNLSIADFGLEESDEGNLVVVTTVENVASSQSSAVLVVAVRIGDKRHEREKQVRVDGDSSTTYRFEFEATREQFQTNGSLDFGWRSGDGTADGG